MSIYPVWQKPSQKSLTCLLTLSSFFSVAINLQAIEALAQAGSKSTQSNQVQTTSNSPKGESQNNADKQEPKFDPSMTTLPQLPQSKDNIDKLISLEKQGDQLLSKNEYDKALSCFQEAYGLSRDMHHGEGEGKALLNMSKLYLQKGQSIKAKELGENAVEILSSGPDKKSLGKAQVNLAQVYLSMDNAIWAAQQLQAAMALYTDVGVNDPEEAAKVQTLVGTILAKQNKPLEAVKSFESASNYFMQAGKHADALRIRTSAISLLQELGLVLAAKEIAEKAVLEARQTKDDVLLTSAFVSLGNCQLNLCEYDAAKKSFEDALKLNAKFTDPLNEAHLETGAGLALLSCGELAPASAYMIRVLPTLTKSGSAYSQAQTYNNLGIILMNKDYPAKACDLFNKALEFISICSPKQDRYNVFVLTNLATAESKSGNNRLAKTHLLAALKLAENMQDKTMVARCASGLAEICLKLKETANAENYVKQGIELSQSIHDDSALWRDFTILAKIQSVKQEKEDLTKDSLVSAVSFFRSPQSYTYFRLHQLQYPTTREELGQQLVSQLISEGLVEHALSVAEQLKEESFIADWTTRSAAVRPEDKDIYKDLMDQRAHLYAIDALGTSPAKSLKEWQNWLGRYRQLASENQSLARLIAPLPMSTDKMLKAAKQKNATIIDYLVGDTSTIAFVIKPDGSVTAKKIALGKKTLQQKVQNLLKALKDQKPSEDQNEQPGEKTMLKQLYNELVPDTIASVLPEDPDSPVVFIPDAVLFNVPFAALITKDDKFLIENHTIQLATSLGTYIDSNPQYENEMSVVVAQGKGSDTSKSTPTQHESEVKKIIDTFQPENVTTLAGSETDKSKLEEALKGKAIFHLASPLSVDDNNPFMTNMPFQFGKTKDDNTAGKLFALSLPNDLAVLSASMVNGPELQGNGVKIISRGLGYAGIRNIVMSLWSTPDANRTEEIVEFYRNGQQGLNKAQSLRKAQLLAIGKNPSVRSWAAFQLIGPGD